MTESTRKISRRTLLKMGAALSAISQASRPGVALAQAACTADSWGAIDGSVAGATGAWTCANYQPKKILEIFLQYGASQWETLWLSGTAAGPDYTAHSINQFGS